MPEDSGRRKLIKDKIGEIESRAAAGLGLIREMVMHYLLSEKGYRPEDIEKDKVFGILLDGNLFPVSVDFIVNLSGRRFMAIKCSPGALESRERHLIAFSRVADSSQIPLAVVTDGIYAIVLDAISGKAKSEGLYSIPDRKRAAEILDGIVPSAYPAEKSEREKRILLAFESIKCTQE